MPAVIPYIPLIVAAVGTTAGAVEQNQQVQHAKGTAQAQQTQADAQIKAINDQTEAETKAASTTASNIATSTSNQAQELATARQRTLAAGSNTTASTILTSPLGTIQAPTITKTLLGA